MYFGSNVLHFYRRQREYDLPGVCLLPRASVRKRGLCSLSVRPSITFVYCIQTAQDIVQTSFSVMICRYTILC